MTNRKGTPNVAIIGLRPEDFPSSMKYEYTSQYTIVKTKIVATLLPKEELLLLGLKTAVHPRSAKIMQIIAEVNLSYNKTSYSFELIPDSAIF